MGNTELIDSVMGNLKDLLQEMSETAMSLEKEWRERSQRLSDSSCSFNIFEPTHEEELRKESERRACDELYDRAKTIRECMNRVAGKINKIIGENIEIQFSKWNI